MFDRKDVGECVSKRPLQVPATRVREQRRARLGEATAGQSSSLSLRSIHSARSNATRKLAG